MTVESADGRYGYRAWDRRPGDGVDPSVSLGPVELIYSIMAQTPPPLSAAITPRLLGYERTQPGIVEVLGVGPAPLMQDTPTKQESGMQPSGINW
jgi:hypothetical protein